MAEIKWSAFPTTTSTSPGDTVVGLQSGVNKQFLMSATPNASAISLWNANENMEANNFLSGYTTTATSATTTILTVSSTYQQYFTGTTTQTVQLPVTSTLVLGQSFYIVNNSTGSITVTSSGSNTIQIMAPNTTMLVTCILTSGTTSLSWNVSYIILPNIMQWFGISGTTQLANPNSGYIIQNSAQTTVTLPATAIIGANVSIRGLGAGGWILTANTGQTIKVDTQTTSSGGTLTSANQYNSIDVTCVVANTTWIASSVISTGLTFA